MNKIFGQLSRPLSQAIQELGYTEPTEIQVQAIPLLLEDEVDFVGQAQTGTGKTAAFSLPLLEKIDLERKELQALILSPTRELAGQIHGEIQKYSKYLDIETTTVYGGVGYREQIDALRTAQIVVATPGRALDLLDRGKLNLENCQHFVIDEADEMLKMGFLEDVETLLEVIPEEAPTWMFSATMPKQIIDLIETKLDSPVIVKVKKKTLSSENIFQSYCKVPRKDFLKALKVVLLSEDDFYGIIFSETREETRQLQEKLTDLGKRVASLHGDLSQRERDISVEQFKNKKVDILVCTDVAARGLDISNVTHVINMGLPRQFDSYVHRIGRTGRAGKVGKAISFVTPRDMKNLRLLEKVTKQQLTTFPIPKTEDVKQKKILSELEKMQTLKQALQKKGSDFQVDEGYDLFKDYFEGLSKDQIMKILFTHHLKRDLRSIEESLENFRNSLKSKPSDRRSGGGRSEGGRGSRTRRSRSGGGRGERSDRGRGRSDERRGRSSGRSERGARGERGDRSSDRGRRSSRGRR